MELEKMEKVNEILQLCFAINQFETRQVEKTGHKPTVFFRFSGHISLLTIQIHKTGWYPKTAEDIEMEIWLYEPFEEIKEYMEECILCLKAIEERCNNEHLQQAV